MAQGGSSHSAEPAGESKNFLRQFRDLKTRELMQISAGKFMDVWNHYDADGNGFIEDKELDNFLLELITSVNTSEVGAEVVSGAALQDAKEKIMNAFDENNDGKIDITELAEILPMEENFLLLFRREHSLESSVEFMKGQMQDLENIWRDYDIDHSGFIEADELKNFLSHLIKCSNTDTHVSEDQLIVYADSVLQIFDRNRDGKLQLSEMAKLLPVKENFLCRPAFTGAQKLTKEDIDGVFKLYDIDGNGDIENDELYGFLKDLMELVQDDYDTEDLAEFKKVLLDTCDTNRDGKINKEELTMVLMAFNRPSVQYDTPLVLDE